MVIASRVLYKLSEFYFMLLYRSCPWYGVSGSLYFVTGKLKSPRIMALCVTYLANLILNIAIGLDWEA